MMTELELKVYEVVRQIPEGKVATYGRVAELAGNKMWARVVGNIMHKNPVPFLELARSVGFTGELSDCMQAPEGFEKVPCHRVVNSKGMMGANFGMGGPEVQAKMLLREGVEVVDGKVNLSEFSM